MGTEAQSTWWTKVDQGYTDLLVYLGPHGVDVPSLGSLSARSTRSRAVSPIPLVHYPLVYKYWKGTQWHGVKKVWFQWKILVQAMSRTTLDDFRAQYFVPDKDGNLQRPKYTPLLKKLELERKAEDEKLAALALVKLTPDQLTYRKGSELIVMKKPAMIAAHYRVLRQRM
ncbi:hypothetical protein K438DRAFT_1954176 [Mycena galopus ATCC 62051]|nr:hypothetical protein K438DRAFT_1954176 [Mycena galopus ATCC 62051]